MTVAPQRPAAPGAVGTAHTRVEGRDKVTGAARYGGDIPFDGLAHGVLVLSTAARGRILSLRTGPVLGMPGVLTVLHHGNASRLTTDYVGMLGVPPDPTAAVFQHDRVPHAGWPVALVVAETPEQARAAADALTVTYDVEPHDVALSADRPDAYPAEGHMPGTTEKGDLEAELAASAHVLDEEYTTPEEHHAMMEPHVATARWDGGRLDLVDSNQGITWVADELARMFSLDPAAVRVRSEHVGGGFGSKGVRAPQVAAAMAAAALGRPVRVALTRRQMFSVTGYRSPTVQRVRLGAGPDGRLRALEHVSLNQTSTVYEFVEPGAGVARTMYDATAHRTENRVVRLDVPSPTWMRAPGRRRGRSRWSARSTSWPRNAASTRSSCGCATSRRAARSADCRSPAATSPPASARAPAASAGTPATRAPACAATGGGCSAPARPPRPSRRAPCRPRRR